MPQGAGQDLIPRKGNFQRTLGLVVSQVKLRDLSIYFESLERDLNYLDLGGECAGVRTRGGLNSSRFVDGMVISPIN